MNTRGLTTAAIQTMVFLVLCPAVSAGPPDEPLYLYPKTGTADCIAIYGTAVDLNKDGNLDLTVSSYCSDDFTVLLGRGNSFFDASIISIQSHSFWPFSIAVADFDSNGTEDLAVANYLNVGNFLVYEGNGDGSFGDPTAYVGIESEFVTTGDFNEDDHLDLIFPGLISFNQGDGTFAGEVSVPSDTDRSVAVADFNGDGKDDYATTRNVYLGDGTGSFSHSFVLPTGTGDEWVTAGDLSGDEIPDLVLSFADDDEVAVVLGNGNGTFASEQRYSLGPNAEPRSTVIADVDKDGLSDVVVATYGGGLPVLYGSGGGSLEPAVYVISKGGFVEGVVVADLNNDGLNDLASPRRSADVCVTMADGPRSFPTNPSSETSGIGNDHTVEVGDVNGDGRADLAATDWAANDVLVLVANGAAAFAPDVRIAVGDAPSSLVFAELTSDGHLDLAVANYSSNNVSILAGNGDGTFTPLTPAFAGPDPWSIVSGDLNDDDVLDLAVANKRNDTISVLSGNGDGSFGLVFPPTAVGDTPTGLALADFDGDLWLDLVAVHEISEDAWILLGDGDGTFTPAPSPYIYPGGDTPAEVEVADLDEDGNLDFVVSGSADSYVYLGNGDGTFAAGTLYSPGGRFVVDADVDGTLDLVQGDNVLIGNGDGTFGGASAYANVANATGDFDLDGRVDLVVLGGNFVRIALNQTGPRAFGFLADKTTLAWPSVVGALSYDIYRGDLSDLVDPDDDGLPDNGYGVCLSDQDDDTRDTHLVDTEMPTPAGAGFFYLRSVTSAQGDSGLGTNSAGQARLPQIPCP